MILGLHHAQITVPPDGIDTAREFYCGFLGLPELPKPDSLAGRGGFWLQVGPQEVHVSPEKNVLRDATKAHLAYQVDDLAALTERLRERGLAVGESVPIPGYERLEIRDPFGNRIEFIQKTVT